MESVLEADDTDLKDQLLSNDGTVVTERIGVYGSALVLNERNFRSDIVACLFSKLQLWRSGLRLAHREGGGTC